MKKSIKITLMSAMLICAASVTYARLTENVSFCNQGTGGLCMPRGDSNGFNCSPVQEGGDCSGTHIQNVE